MSTYDDTPENDPPFPCLDCGSGDLYRAVGSAANTHTFIVNGRFVKTSYANIPGWSCKRCGHWSPDPLAVDEEGRPRERMRSTNRPSHMREIDETLARYVFREPSPCSRCDSSGLKTVVPLKLCPVCDGLSTARTKKSAFLLEQVLQHRHELLQKVRAKTPPPPPRRPTLSNDKSYWYGILGLKHGATAQEIKKAYKRRSKIYHPDNVDTGDAKEFQLVSQAKEMLLK